MCMIGGKNGDRKNEHMFGEGGNLGLSVTPSDVRMGKTFTRDCKTIESGTLNLTNLTPGNIKKGVIVDNVVGTYEGSNPLLPVNPVREGEWDSQGAQYHTFYLAHREAATIHVAGTISIRVSGFNYADYYIYKNSVQAIKGYLRVGMTGTHTLSVGAGDVLRFESEYGSGSANIYFKLKNKIYSKH